MLPGKELLKKSELGRVTGQGNGFALVAKLHDLRLIASGRPRGQSPSVGISGCDEIRPVGRHHVGDFPVSVRECRPPASDCRHRSRLDRQQGRLVSATDDGSEGAQMAKLQVVQCTMQALSDGRGNLGKGTSCTRFFHLQCIPHMFHNLGESRADRLVDNYVGEPVERCFRAVDDDKPGAIVLSL